MTGVLSAGLVKLWDNCGLDRVGSGWIELDWVHGW